VQLDGTLSNGRVFAELGEHRPDGMKVDEKGNVYVTASFVWVFDSKGKHLGNINTPDAPANCSFGGSENKTLFITARPSVYRIELKVAGATTPGR
jgi:gluconolactonase